MATHNTTGRASSSKAKKPESLTKLDKQAALARIPAFAGLAQEDLSALADLAVVKRFAARREVFHKGDRGLEAYAILSGRLKATASSPEGRELTFSIMGPGEVFGEIAMLYGGERTASVIAIEASELLVIHRRDLMALFERKPATAIAVMSSLAELVSRLTEQMEDAHFRNLPARLARKLIALVDGSEHADGDADSLGVKLSQSELGSLVGTSREAVNKQLKQWERDGVIDGTTGQIRIKSREVLERLADEYTL